MTERSGHVPRRPRTPRSELDHRLYGELRRAPAAPDLTADIMRRLGYVPAAPVEAQRLRGRRRLGRAAMTMAAGAAIAVGYGAYLTSPQAAPPPGPTIPAAIGNDLQRHQHRIRELFQGIRHITPRPTMRDIERTPDDLPPAPPDVRQDAEDAGAAPVRWA